MAIPTLAGITLEGCSNIRVEKSSNIIPIPLPAADSEDAEVFDLLGVLKFVAVTGSRGGATATLKSFVDSLEALEAGVQSATVNFISDQTGTVKCMVMSVQSSWDIPGTIVNYDIKLVQGVTR